jgi:hypothetical protein
MTRREQALLLCILGLLVAGTYTWVNLIACTMR